MEADFCLIPREEEVAVISSGGNKIYDNFSQVRAGERWLKSREGAYLKKEGVGDLFFMHGSKLKPFVSDWS